MTDEKYQKCRKCGRNMPIHVLNEDGICGICQTEQREGKKSDFESRIEEINHKVRLIKTALSMTKTDGLQLLSEADKFIEALVKVYEADVDIVKEIYKMDLWFSTLQKWKKDYKAFVVRWLNKTHQRNLYYRNLQKLK